MPRVTFKVPCRNVGDIGLVSQMCADALRRKNAAAVQIGADVHPAGTVTIDTYNVQEVVDRSGGGEGVRYLCGEIIFAVRDPLNPHAVDELGESVAFDAIADMLIAGMPSRSSEAEAVAETITADDAASLESLGLLPLEADGSSGDTVAEDPAAADAPAPEPAPEDPPTTPSNAE